MRSVLIVFQSLWNLVGITVENQSDSIIQTIKVLRDFMRYFCSRWYRSHRADWGDWSSRACGGYRTWRKGRNAGRSRGHRITGVHDDVIKWNYFPRYWSLVRGIHRSPVNSPRKGQWRRALMFSLMCAGINGWVNNREAGDLRRHCARYDVTVMIHQQRVLNARLCEHLGTFFY